MLKYQEMVNEMQCELNEKRIDIEIIRKNNKNLYMRFQDADTLTVTCNRWVSVREIQKIIEKNKKTLEKMQAQKEKETERDEHFYYLGTPYEKILDGTTKEPFFEQGYIIAKDEKTLQKFYQKECQRVFKSELNRILPCFSNIPPFTLKYRQMKTRWGVNNQGSKTITLNTELLKKDLDLLDYVIIHELCHFYEPNHSARFWAAVEEYYPKYKEARKRLRG